MKSFSIDIESLQRVAYAAEMTTMRVKVTLTEDLTSGNDFSEMHMSETTMRLMHQGLSKVIKELDENSAVSVITCPALPANSPRRT